MRTEIMGVGFDDLTLDEAAGAAAGMIEAGGFHYVVTPNPELVDRARREEPFQQALNGADLVLGHHPHVLEGIEEYQGKNIVYSLGNFCFGGNAYPSDMNTMIFQQTFTIKDGALQQDNVKNIIPCRISSEDGYNNYQPTPAKGEQGDDILKKIKEYSSWVQG